MWWWCEGEGLEMKKYDPGVDSRWCFSGGCKELNEDMKTSAVTIEM